jgi:malonate transporter and related proteins
MSLLWQCLRLSAPLFAVVGAGYALAFLPFWRALWTGWASKFVFNVALPALLFGMMSDLSTLPPVDTRLLAAFFGGCLIVFALGRLLARELFELSGAAQSVFALGGVFSNNVLLGVPLAKLTLGDAALPSVALVLVFNALTLWTLVTISVEWSRTGSLTLAGFGTTALNVLRNPIVAAILTGTAFGLSGLRLPAPLDAGLAALGDIAAPAALLVLGMGLAEYGVREDWRQSATICALKLVVHPLVVWGLALTLGLPPTELRAVVLLASLSVGANVYLMSVQFQAVQGPVASSLVLSTALAALTTPILLTVLLATD